MPSSENESNETIAGSERHLGLYIAGLPGGGKSSLIQNIALDDIKHGSGVSILDPTRDLIGGLVHHLPEQRLDDIILFDTAKPVAIDFFSYDKKNPIERDQLINMLVKILDIQEAPVSRPRVRRIINTLLDANNHPDIPDTRRTTFLDIEKFLLHKGRRDQILSYCSQEAKVEWKWLDAVANPEKFHESITERISDFIHINASNVIFGAKRPKVNIAEVIEKRRILLINLHNTRSDFDLAALIMAKFQQATFGRANVPEDERENYYLYIDECHDVLRYARDEFGNLLTGARKFRLCMALANQLPNDLPDTIKAKLPTLQASILFALPPDHTQPFRHRFPEPHTPRDYSVERQRLVAEHNRIQNERESHWDSVAPTETMSMNDRLGEAGAQAALSKMVRLAARGESR